MAILPEPEITPPSLNLESKPVYNPLPIDFTHSWDGVPYTIPAGQIKQYPAFLAAHLAKHLARQITARKWAIKVQKEAVGQITPDTAKGVPLEEEGKLTEALLSGNKDLVVDTMGELFQGQKVLEYEELKDIEVKKEEAKAQEKTPEEIAEEKKVTDLEAKRQRAAHARAMRKIKKGY